MYYAFLYLFILLLKSAQKYSLVSTLIFTFFGIYEFVLFISLFHLAVFAQLLS